MPYINLAAVNAGSQCCCRCHSVSWFKSTRRSRSTSQHSAGKFVRWPSEWAIDQEEVIW